MPSSCLGRQSEQRFWATSQSRWSLAQWRKPSAENVPLCPFSLEGHVPLTPASCWGTIAL